MGHLCGLYSDFLKWLGRVSREKVYALQGVTVPQKYNASHAHELHLCFYSFQQPHFLKQKEIGEINFNNIPNNLFQANISKLLSFKYVINVEIIHAISHYFHAKSSKSGVFTLTACVIWTGRMLALSGSVWLMHCAGQRRSGGNLKTRSFSVEALEPCQHPPGLTSRNSCFSLSVQFKAATRCQPNKKQNSGFAGLIHPAFLGVSQKEHTFCVPTLGCSLGASIHLFLCLPAVAADNCMCRFGCKGPLCFPIVSGHAFEDIIQTHLLL